MHVDRAFKNHGAFANGSIHQLLAGEGPAGRFEHDFQQAEFRGGKIQLAIVHKRSVTDSVDTHVAVGDLVFRFGRSLGTSFHSFNALNEYLHTERLGDIIVRT